MNEIINLWIRFNRWGRNNVKSRIEFCRKKPLGGAVYYFYLLTFYQLPPLILSLLCFFPAWICAWIKIVSSRKKNRDKKKIFFISHQATPQGAPLSLYTLLSEIDRATYRYTVAFPEKGTISQKVQAIGIEIVYMPLSNLLYQRITFPILIHNLILLLINLPPTCLYLAYNEIDLVHTNVLVTPDAALAARLLRIPNVWHLRETLLGSDTWKWFQIMMISKVASKIICTTRFGASQLSGREASSKVEIIHNAVCFDTFRDNGEGYSFRKEMSFGESAKVAVVIGQVTEDKGHEFFVRAAVQIIKEFPDSFFFCVGTLEDVPYVQMLKEISRELGLGNERLIFTGTRLDVPRVIAAADVIVVPSIWQEVFGRTIIEAMAMKKPVVATRVGGIPEVLQDGVTGFLVPPANDIAMAAAINKLFSDKKLCRDMGEAGFSRARSLFDSKKHARRIEAIYEMLLS